MRIILLVAFLAMLVIGKFQLDAARQASPEDAFVFDLELAKDAPTAKILIDDPFNNLDALRKNTYIDFLFIVAYSTALFAAFSLLNSFFNLGGFWKYLPYIFLIPGLCDVVENLYILQFSQHNFMTGSFMLYYILVRIKWTMAIPGFVGGVLALGLTIWKLFRKA